MNPVLTDCCGQDFCKSCLTKWLYVIVVTHARVPHGIYWLSSDLGPRAQASKAKALLSQYIPCVHE